MADLNAPWPGAVAVSGGSDSLALMFLLRDWAMGEGLPPPVVATVDHALRPESKVEARRVARWAKAARLEAEILTRTGKAPGADIEAAARQARYRLIGAWAKRRALKAVYVAHTSDDQAETFLLRLARGSGVDGLSAMRPVSPWPVKGFAGLTLVRPLLAFERQALRAFLKTKDQDWIDDPMNEDPRFARVRIRNAWPALEALGLGKSRIVETAMHLSRAREALEAAAAELARRACLKAGEDVLVDPRVLTRAPRELGLRVLANALMAVSKQDYRPRFERLARLYQAISEGSLRAGCTLHGCKIAPAPRAAAHFGAGTLLIRREPGRKKAKETKD